MSGNVVALLDADGWNALAQMLLAIGAGSAAIAGVYSYRKSRRAEAARWMIETFKSFYTDDAISRGRDLLEYDYEDVVAPLCELRVLDRHIILSEKSRSELRDLDLVLNFLEQILYLEDEGHLLAKDRDVFFEYWFALLADPKRSALRRYLRNCGYERCSDFLSLAKDEYLVAYGSLMTACRGRDEELAADGLESVGSCIVAGRLYSRGEFPALVPGDEAVEGEIFRLPSKESFGALDELEHYDASDLDGSLYRRRCIHLEKQRIDAWVYYWNQSLDELTHLEGGSWAEHSG